ncbi:MAG TPA: hypothetical protein QF572_19300 [Vicinamibacterales bacterium]|jgi:hypothetical protein|nr:hypothetical protein [Vicinamibacterales bacterium]|tara:strand:+ start:436 stop:867 length:432 start_codon:yes stop_codon:yes gene_type:complete
MVIRLIPAWVTPTVLGSTVGLRGTPGETEFSVGQKSGGVNEPGELPSCHLGDFQGEQGNSDAMLWPFIPVTVYFIISASHHEGTTWNSGKPLQHACTRLPHQHHGWQQSRKQRKFYSSPETIPAAQIHMLHTVILAEARAEAQ